jgi:hypothetical protein
MTDPGNIPILRTLSQQIGTPVLTTAAEVAGRMVALQAQDYGMSKWAFGIRIPGSTEIMIDDEIDSGKIIRMHLLRPTWHFAASADVRWLLRLSSSHIKSALKYRDRQLELDEKIFTKCNSIIEKALTQGEHLSREGLIQELKRSGIQIDENRASHILVRAEMEGIICSGKQKNGKPSYALLEERVPPGDRNLSKAEALKELAFRYFSSRGPATIRDFAWWSGLPLSDSSLAVKHNSSWLVSETINDRTYWFNDAIPGTGHLNDKVHLLPSYDEFLISYADRSASLAMADNKKAISSNGIFYPAIMTNGQITGTWKRIAGKDAVIISCKIFGDAWQCSGNAFGKAVNRYSEFLGKEVRPEAL